MPSQSPIVRLACCNNSNRSRCVHCSFKVRITRSTMPFCSGLCGVMKSWRRPYPRTRAAKLRLVNTSPLSELRRNNWGTLPSAPNRANNACSSADSAVFDRQLRERCQPSNSPLRHSITSANVAQQSRPAQILHRSVAQRSFGHSAAASRALIWGLKPTGRFLSLQPLSWKITAL